MSTESPTKNFEWTALHSGLPMKVLSSRAFCKEAHAKSKKDEIKRFSIAKNS
jgi:hypothetical protein